VAILWHFIFLLYVKLRTMVYFLLLFFVCYHGQWSSTILVSWLLRVSCQTSSLCYQSVVLQFCHIPSTILNITVFTSWWFFCFFILQMWLYDFLFLYFITLTTVLPGMSFCCVWCIQYPCITLSNPVLTKLNGGLSWLHSADEDAVSWLTSYGSWNAYEKKQYPNLGCV